MKSPASENREETDGTVSQRSDVSHAARSGTIQGLTIAAQAMLTVAHILLARLFGRTVFGSYQASVAILEMLTRAGTGGADKAMLRYIAAHRADGAPELVRRALGTGLRLSLVVAGLAAALLMIFAPVVAHLSREPALTPALRMMAPAAVFTGCMWVLVQASLAAKVTRANFIVRGLSEPLFLLSAGLLAALAGRSLLHLATAHLVASIATFLVAIAVVGRVFGRGELRRAFASHRLPGFAGFSLPLGIGELMNAVLQRADIVLLTMFLGTGAAAVYAAAEFITRIIANARYVFDSVAAPMFSEAIQLRQRERLRRNLVTMTRWVVSAAAPLAATVLALRYDLLALYGPGFSVSAGALTVLAIGHFVNSSLGLSGWILVADGRSRLMLLNNLAGACANIIMGLTLIPRFGVVGTAIAALGSITLVQVLLAIEVALLRQVHPFSWALVKPLLAAGLSLAAQLFVCRHIVTAGIRVPLVITVGVIVYVSALLLFKLEPEDQPLLESAINRLRRWLRLSRAAGRAPGSTPPRAP